MTLYKFNSKIKLSEIMYIFISIMVFISSINNSMFKSVFPLMSNMLSRLFIMFRILLVCFSIVDVFRRKQTKFDTLLMIIYSACFLASYYFTKSWDLFDALFISIFMSKQLEYDKVVNCFYKPLIFSLVIILGGYLIGLFPNMQLVRSDGTLRKSFGFLHPNDLGRIILLISFLYILKNRKNIRCKHIIIICSLAIFTYIFPNSKDVTFSLIMFVFIIAIRQLFLYLKKRDFFTSKFFYVILFITILGITSMLWYLEANEVYDEVLKFIAYNIYSRFSSARTAMNEYGLNIFGHNIQFAAESSLQYGWAIRYFTLDSAYFYIPIARGVFPAIFILVIYLQNLRYSFKNRNSIILIEIFIMTIYSILEPGILYFIASFIFILPKTKEKLIT